MTSTAEVVKLMEKDPTAVASYMPQVIQAIQDDDEILEKTGDLKDSLEDHLLKEFKSKDNKYEEQMLDLCQACLEKRATKYYELAKVMFNDKQIINWKKHVTVAEKLIKTFEVPVELVRNKKDDWWGKDLEPSQTEMGKAISSCIEAMLEGFSRDKILKKLNKCVVELLVVLFKSPNDLQVVIGHHFVSSSCHGISWDGTDGTLPNLFKAIHVWMTTADLDLESISDEKTAFINETIQSSLSNAGSPSKYSKEVGQIFQYILTHELDGQPYSGWGLIAQTICTEFVMKHCGNKRLIKDFVPGIIKILKGDNENLVTIASSSIVSFYQQVDLLAPCAEDVIDVFLDGKSDMLGLVLKPLYGVSPEKILNRFDLIVEAMEDMGQTNKTYIYMLWTEVAKDNPKILVPHVDLMMDDVTDGQLCNQVVMVLASVSVYNADVFIDKVDTLMTVAKQTPYTIHAVAKIVGSVGLINQEQANRCLGILAEKLKTTDDIWISTILMEMKRIGRKYVEILKTFRSEIEALKSSQQMGVPDLVQSLVDFMEGRSLEALADDSEQVKDGIQNLNNRVTETEQNVDQLDKTVTENSYELENIKNQVGEQGERLDELEEGVDDMALKVDEIDNKTITNAPKWSKSVSKLLNPEHKQDWRYLAIRLGFTAEDVRNWALSPDPTMAILAEWYTVHKSSDATYAVLAALEDMGRADAAGIVQESLEAAESVVPKATTELSQKPPKIFISYQWDHQAQVKVVKEHLEKAGFRCWMDIGQMGGGDSLYAKINDGMRATKVVLCMCTEKYAKSENCNKEVNLANLLNKPIIPLLIEKLAWPPIGSMSMLFAQLLYIQFFSDKDYIRGDKFWEDNKFAELLAQINYHCAPDQEMISDEYRDWIPQIDDVPNVAKKADGKVQTDAPEHDNTRATEVQEVVPQVFISYQWEKQTVIKKLYNKLTSLGFNCWLDILQMGGGDPLYSKIDKGIRGAKVVISSVTPKYALSANCRREISLSDALGKPIIPILMQEMSWPPEGPMSMPFSNLLYIDCTNQSTQAEFHDAKFEELVRKIKEHATIEEEILQQVCPDKNTDKNNISINGNTKLEEHENKGTVQTLTELSPQEPTGQKQANDLVKSKENGQSGSPGPKHSKVAQDISKAESLNNNNKKSSVCGIL